MRNVFSKNNLVKTPGEKEIKIFIIKSIIRSLIIFKKPRKMTNDFFNNYIFVHTFQWTSSECLINVTVTVKVAMVTYRHCKKG